MSPQTGWILQEKVVPRLRSAIPHAVNFIGCEDAQELVQDSIAMAAKLMHNNERKRKKVTPGNVAYYTIQHVKSGRRSVGYSAADVMGSATQLKGRTRLHSLEEVVAADAETGGEIFTLNDVLSNDSDDPSMAVARKMDWQDFYTGLPKRERVAIEYLLEGKTLRDAAHVLKCSDSAMQLSKKHLVQAIQEFMGADILVEVKRKPQWKEDLTATKEKMACRHERSH